jgi:hypothetical protein
LYYSFGPPQTRLCRECSFNQRANTDSIKQTGKLRHFVTPVCKPDDVIDHRPVLDPSMGSVKTNGLAIQYITGKHASLILPSFCPDTQTIMILKQQNADRKEKTNSNSVKE